MRNHFGTTPSAHEPCFYNQDWYVKESFALAAAGGMLASYSRLSA